MKFEKGNIPWHKGTKGLVGPNSGSFTKGQPSWNKGKVGYKAGAAHYGFGKHRSEETKRKISLARCGQRASPETEFKKGQVPWIKGKKGAFITWNKGKKLPHLSGPNSPNWQGGVTDETHMRVSDSHWHPLRRAIYQRDAHTCQFCGRNHCKVFAHHIDYDGRNNDPMNLITLCNNCHAETNFHRDDWQFLLTEVWWMRQLERASVALEVRSYRPN